MRLPERAPAGRWYDSINVSSHGQVDLVMDFTDPIIKGMSVFHCHLLKHEDKGMMAKILFRSLSFSTLPGNVSSLRDSRHESYLPGTEPPTQSVEVAEAGPFKDSTIEALNLGHLRQTLRTFRNIRRHESLPEVSKGFSER